MVRWEHPKDVGDRTTLAVMLTLRGYGHQIAVPFGENTRYDLILDDGAELLRIQCKTGRLRNGAVEFSTASSYAHHPNEKSTQRHLRVTTPRNGQRKRIRFATDYEIGRVGCRAADVPPAPPDEMLV
jgi:hypothetical protein